MEPLLQIIIYNLCEIFKASPWELPSGTCKAGASPCDELRSSKDATSVAFSEGTSNDKITNAHVYLVFRELCKWSRDNVDLFLPPMRAKSVFTIRKIVRHGKRPSDVYHLLPNGKRNGLCKKFVYDGGFIHSFYLSDKLITKCTKHYYINGRKKVQRRTGNSNTLVYNSDCASDVVCITIEPSVKCVKTIILVIINGIKFRETNKGLDYSLRVFDDCDDWCVKYRYAKSHIYNIKEVAEALVTLTQCGEGAFYEKALAFERTHKWRFQYGKPKKSMFGKRREDLRI